MVKHNFGKQIYGEIWERDGLNGFCPGERDRSEETKEVRNRLLWEACLLPRTMVMLDHGLLPKTMSGFMTLSLSVSVDIHDCNYHQKS